MNPRGLTDKISVVRANDNTGMARLIAMEANKVLPIKRQDRSPLADRERQDFRILNRLLRLSGFKDRQHIVSQKPQFIDDGLGKILIGIQQSHGLSVLVLSNL